MCIKLTVAHEIGLRYCNTTLRANCEHYQNIAMYRTKFNQKVQNSICNRHMCGIQIYAPCFSMYMLRKINKQRTMIGVNVDIPSQVGGTFWFHCPFVLQTNVLRPCTTKPVPQVNSQLNPNGTKSNDEHSLGSTLPYEMLNLAGHCTISNETKRNTSRKSIQKDDFGKTQ